MGVSSQMKTTLEIPDPVFRRAKSAAAERGISLREFVTAAVVDKLAAERRTVQRPWMAAFGKLRSLRKETAKVNRVIDEEFEQIEAEDRLRSWTRTASPRLPTANLTWSPSFAKQPKSLFRSSSSVNTITEFLTPAIVFDTRSG